MRVERNPGTLGVYDFSRHHSKIDSLETRMNARVVFTTLITQNRRVDGNKESPSEANKVRRGCRVILIDAAAGRKGERRRLPDLVQTFILPM